MYDKLQVHYKPEAVSKTLKSRIICNFFLMPTRYIVFARCLLHPRSMTPEELNRTMEFIIASQARLAAAQEQDRQDRIEFQEWSKGLTAQVVQLSGYQSGRMDRLDKFYQDSLRQTGDFQKQALDFQRQALHLLHLILDRLPPAPTLKPN